MQMAVEHWGSPAMVAAIIDEHNQRTIDVAQRHRNTMIVDQVTGIPASGESFSDVCHLTPAGCKLFVSNLLKEVEPTITRWMESRRNRDTQ